MPPDTRSDASQLLPSPELLAYYKARIEAFDKERDELLSRISACQSSASEAHTLRCETQKRAQEVRELQKALSDAHVHLFDERERLLRVQAENDELRLEQIEDRRRVQHLLALTQPVEQEITLSRDGDPRTGVVFPRCQAATRPKRPGAKAATAAGAADLPAPAQDQRIMRTVYLPADNADGLRLRVESLQAQLDEQLQFASERAAAMLDDRRIREQDEAAHRANFQRQVEALTEKLRRTEEALRGVTTDYILARRDKQAAEGRAADAEALLAQERQAAAAKLADVKRTLEDKMAKLKAEGEAKHARDVEHHQKQLKGRETEISQLESMHSAVKAQYEQRIADLEERCSKAKDKVKQAELRRVLDMEGFTNDISLLRKQLAAVDRKLHQMRLLDRLEDDERLTSLLRSLENKAPTVPSPRQLGIVKARGRQSDAASETSEAVGELREIKNQLVGVEDRLRRSSLKSRGT